MFSLDDARAFVARVTPKGRQDDFFAHARYVDRYEVADAAERATFRAAMTALLEGGDEGESALAANFFGTVGVSPELLCRLAREYVKRRWDSSHPAATVIGDGWPLLAQGDADVLKGVFLADPARHLRVAHAVVPHDRTGAAWDALAVLVERTDDPAALLLAFKAAFAAKREADFHALMCRKPQDTVRAVADQLAPGAAGRLRAACGLSA